MSNDNRIDDEIFNDIKVECFKYLSNDKSASEYSDVDLSDAKDFLNEKFAYVNSLKKNFSLMEHTFPFADLEDTRREFHYENSCENFNKMSKQARNLKDQIALLYGIIEKIEKEK